MYPVALCVALLQQLGAPPPAFTARQPASEEARSPSLYVRPLASLLVPGTGQLMAGQDRGAVYLAAEVYLLSRYVQLDHQATQEAQRYQDLAFDVARRTFQPMGKDTVFEYYEQMGRFVESGAYDVDGPGGAFVPEPDRRTYNGSVWLLARRTFWADPDVPPDPASWQYAQALAFYRARAVTPNFQWSWREHSLEHQVYGDYMHSSDDAFRKAQSQIGLLLANHLVSAIDALISARMSAATGRNAEMRTLIGVQGRTQVRFSVSF